jgi:hypothetical protein
MNVERINWEPGNGTRYDIVYAEDSGGRIYFTWLHRSSSGGGTICFRPGGYLHYTYLMEKMGIRLAGDAAGLLAFLHAKGHTVGMPDGWDGWFRPEDIKRNNLDSLVALQ